MTAETMPPEPWVKYRAHADATAYRMPGAVQPYRIRIAGRELDAWLKLMQKVGATVSEPTPENPMQSAPYVLFASYDARARRDHTTKTHPFILATFCEGDTITEFYPTAADRARALYLLERAL